MDSFLLNLANSTTNQVPGATSSARFTLVPYVSGMTSAVKHIASTTSTLVGDAAGISMDTVAFAASSIQDVTAPYFRDMTNSVTSSCANWNGISSIPEHAVSELQNYLSSIGKGTAQLGGTFSEHAAAFVTSNELVANVTGMQLICGAGLGLAAYGLAAARRKRARPHQIAANQLAAQDDAVLSSDVTGSLISGSSMENDDNGGEIKRRRMAQTEKDEDEKEEVEDLTQKDKDKACQEDIDMQPTQVEVSEEEDGEENEDSESYLDEESYPEEDQMDIEEHSAGSLNQVLQTQPQQIIPTKTVVAIRSQPIFSQTTVPHEEAVATVMLSMGSGKEENPMSMSHIAIVPKPERMERAVVSTKSNSKRLQPDQDEPASEEEKEAEDQDMAVSEQLRIENRKQKAHSKQKPYARSPKPENGGSNFSSQGTSSSRFPANDPRGGENKGHKPMIDLTGDE